MVYLCHSECHCFGVNAVHHNADAMRYVRQYGQRKAMKEQGWTPEDFRRVFGKNYLEDES
ncbi:MAG: hypothetical protein IJI06_08815 [Oscillospiraceae bacterium]|nr:hypothetical protein [Oscillospiraceae bacterium]